MSNEPRHDRHFESLLDELDRSSLSASDAEVLEDARAAGVNPAANAQELKAKFLGAARRHQKRKFEAAKLAHAKQSEALSKRSCRIPESPAEQRRLLQLVIARQAQAGYALTAKFRDFDSLPDSDLPDLIEELEALDLLPQLNETE
jgi:hypothetical protein